MKTHWSLCQILQKSAPKTTTATVETLLRPIERNLRHRSPAASSQQLHSIIYKQKLFQICLYSKNNNRISLPESFTPIEDAASFKGTNGRQKTFEVFHVYCIFYSGFMSQTTVIFGITKDGSLESNNLASWNCFTCRNLFQNGANDMSECLTFETAFCKKAQNFV